jgi:hypothetical protein
MSTSVMLLSVNLPGEGYAGRSNWSEKIPNGEFTVVLQNLLLTALTLSRLLTKTSGVVPAIFVLRIKPKAFAVRSDLL